MPKEISIYDIIDLIELIGFNKTENLDFGIYYKRYKYSFIYKKKNYLMSVWNIIYCDIEYSNVIFDVDGKKYDYNYYNNYGIVKLNELKIFLYNEFEIILRKSKIKKLLDV